jgi:hypothetical protein
LQTGKALPFIVGCPACQHNFIHLWCVMTCSPDQATFVNISEVQTAADTNATVVKTVEVWLDKAFSQQLYDSCKVSRAPGAAQLVLWVAQPQVGRWHAAAHLCGCVPPSASPLPTPVLVCCHHRM